MLKKLKDNMKNELRSRKDIIEEGTVNKTRNSLLMKLNEISEKGSTIASQKGTVRPL